MTTLPTADQLQAWDLDPAWSTTVEVPSHDGSTHRWHVLDTGRAPGATSPVTTPRTTMLCVHGNPTWAYAWASLLRRLGATHRVIAIDQLGMGFSDRVGPRTYTQRIRDLDDVIGALAISDDVPLVLAAHDWGGAIAMGWAVDHVDALDGMVLCNTGIAVPTGRSSPSVIRLAASRPLRDVVCRRTNAFVEGTIRLSGSALTAADRDAFRAPYRTAADRTAIEGFVGDIPLQPGGGHPTDEPLADVAARLSNITAPVLLAWGLADPVFDDDFAADLEGRLANAVTHRFPSANHLVMAEAGVAAVAERWLDDLVSGRLRTTSEDQSAPDAGLEPLWSALRQRHSDDTVAFVDLATGDELSWAALADRVERGAAELRRRGLRTGDRVALLTPPGTALVAAVYAVWRAGGVTVVADRGLGLRGLGRAVRGSRPRWVIGPKRALAAAAALRWAPHATRLLVDDIVGEDVPAATAIVPEPTMDDPAAVLFTSGATGPAKGVRYRHRQLAAQRDALRATYGIGPDDRLVAAFAPFALYGPALGIPTALPDCDVTSPGQLTATALDQACERIGATLAFGSPAALANVVATAEGALPALARLRTVMSAGAPVPVATLRRVSALAPTATVHTPYGMTEALPVADVDLAGIEAALASGDSRGGVCVGRPVTGASVRIGPLDADSANLPDSVPDGDLGEIFVSAPWVSDGYSHLWATQRDARPASTDGTVWHRSGDVGHIDTEGRLWVEGRAVHVIRTADGPVTSVPIETAIEAATEFDRVAAVAVGPDPVQQVVVIVEDSSASEGLATGITPATVRAAVGVPVAAVLSLSKLPVDIRHNSKIDRAALGRWAGDLLAGRRSRAPR